MPVALRDSGQLSGGRWRAADRELVLLAAIVGAAAVVRFATLGHQSYDHDEAVTAWRVLRGGLGQMLGVVVHSERSPPLYYLLAWPWAKLFGTGEVGLRSLSALIGCLTVPAAYLAARQLGSGRAGLIAAALVAFNPYLVWYSQEARSYALVVLLIAWGLVFFARSLSDPSPRNLALWAAASALAICSHYFAAFVVGAEGLWLLATSRPRRRPVVAFGATVVAGLALLPLAIAQEGSGRRNHFTTVPILHRVGGTVVGFLASAEPAGLSGSPPVRLLRDAAVIVGLLAAGLALFLLVRRASASERRGGIVFAAVGGAALIVPFALAAGGLDFVDPRNLIGALVPLLLAAGIGLGCARAGRLGLAGAGAAIAAFGVVIVGVFASAQMQRPDWRAAAAAIGPASGPRVLVVPRNGNEPIALYRKAREFRSSRFGAVRVREIDVLATLPSVSPPDGFHPVERRRMAPCCTLWRYRAPRPTLVRARDVSGRRVLQERSSVLIEGAAGR
ncbi:MAG: glycosyltransferase family 39 protein [Solirubrobacterales bacterium]